VKKQFIDAVRIPRFKGKIYCVSYTILIIVVLLYTFKSYILTYYFRIQFQSPVRFHNIEIMFPKGVIYKTGEKSIFLWRWDNPNSSLYIREINPKAMNKESLIQYFKNKKFFILETKDIYFKGFASFMISYIDTSWMYNKDIYIIRKNLIINYKGSKEDYTVFKVIIDNMKFL